MCPIASETTRCHKTDESGLSAIDGMKAPPFVSVVVIVLNGASTIRTCLDSLLHQRYPLDRYEIVVVDNGSTDDTPQIVRQYPVRLVYEQQRGYAWARNAGVRNAQGEVIAFMDADCVADAHWLSELTKPYADPTIGAVAGRLSGFFAENSTVVEKFIDRTGLVAQAQPDRDGFLPYIATANASYRKEVIERAGLFDTSLSSCEDVELARRVQLVLGVQARYVSTAVVFHRNRSTVRGLYRFMQRNGRDEIIMAARWRQYPQFQTTFVREVLHMVRQVFALMVYLRSVIYRALVWLLYGADKEYVVHPWLCLVAEGANIVGKLQGFFITRHLWISGA